MTYNEYDRLAWRSHKALIRSLQRENAALKESRDQMLAALEGLMSSIENYELERAELGTMDEYDMIMAPRWEAARAAIKQAKETQ